MANIANITVFDGASTPVVHTLTAISISREGKKIKANWREVNAAVPTEAQITVEMMSEKLASGVIVQTQRTLVPVMESISGQNAAGYTAAPKVAFVDTFITTSYQHPRSTPTSRRISRQLHLNVNGNIATSVAAATSGFAPDLFDLQVLPT